MVNAVPTKTKDVLAQPQRGDLVVRRVPYADEATSYVIVEWSHRYVLEGPFGGIEAAASKALALAAQRQVCAWLETENAEGPGVVML